MPNANHPSSRAQTISHPKRKTSLSYRAKRGISAVRVFEILRPGSSPGQALRLRMTRNFSGTTTKRRNLEQLFRNIAAVLGELAQDGLVQPHVHLSGVTHFVARASELAREALSRFETAVEVEQLQQVDDRCLPVELLRVRSCQPFQFGNHIDFRNRHDRRCRRSGRRRLLRRGGIRGRRRCSFRWLAESELLKDRTEQTHLRLLFRCDAWGGVREPRACASHRYLTPRV